MSRTGVQEGMGQELNFPDTVDQVERLLRSTSPQVAYEKMETPAYVAFFLEPNPGDDYRFSFWLYPDLTGMGISANLLPIDEDPDSTPYFWSRRLEIAAFDSVSEMFSELYDILRIVISSDTKVVQTKGLLFMGFELQYDADGDWRSLSGGAAFRFSNIPLRETNQPSTEFRAGKLADLPDAS